jgi:hypothetical protein
MEEADADLLASTTLSLNQHRDIGFGYAFQLTSDSLHGRTFAEDDVQRRETE